MLRPLFSSLTRSIPKISPQHLSSKLLFTTSLAHMANAHSYKLKYFNFRVIGEPIRWQFILAGVPFEDQRLPRDSWDAEGKAQNGWGRLPILEIDEDMEITQSCAISRFLAAQFDQLPQTDLLRARADELVDNLQDLRLLWRPFVRESDEAKRRVLAKEMVQVHFAFYLPKIEAFIRKNGGNGFAVGEKLSWADLYLANFLQIWTENHGKELLENFPALEAHKDKIVNIPQIKAWIQIRPTTGY